MSEVEGTLQRYTCRLGALVWLARRLEAFSLPTEAVGPVYRVLIDLEEEIGLEMQDYLACLDV